MIFIFMLQLKFSELQPKEVIGYYKKNTDKQAKIN